MMDIKKIKINPIIAASFIVILGNNFSNALNYIYHLIIARMLGPSQYGTLASLISLGGLLIVISSSIGFVITKYVSANSSLADSSSIARWFRSKYLLAILLLGTPVLFLAPMISSFLKVELNLILITILFYIGYIPLACDRAILQGLIRFKDVVISSLVENTFRIIFSILFIYLGLGAMGGIAGILVATLITVFLLYLYLNNLIKSKEKIIPTLDKKELFRYTLPTVINSLALTSLYSMDVILAKHFLPAIEAGAYAALSLVGKIIFFGTAPIAMVLFPNIAKQFHAKQKFLPTLLIGLALLSILAIVASSVFTLFPETVVSALYGKAYVNYSTYLMYFAIFMTIFSLCNLLINFFIAVNVTKVAFVTVGIVMLQIVLIYLNHSSIFDIVISSLASVSIFLVILIVILFYTKKTND